jgi:hypothetical protein
MERTMKRVVADRKVAERKSHTCSDFGRFVVEEDCDCECCSTGDVDDG